MEMNFILTLNSLFSLITDKELTNSHVLSSYLVEQGQQTSNDELLQIFGMVNPCLQLAE